MKALDIIAQCPFVVAPVCVFEWSCPLWGIARHLGECLSHGKFYFSGSTAGVPIGELDLTTS